MTTSGSRLRLEYIAVRLLAGDLPGEEIPDLATWALVEGFDSPALREAAGATHSDPRDARDLLRVAVRELGVEVPDDLATVRYRMARFWAEEIVAGEIQPVEGARRLSALAIAEGFDDLAIFSGLESQIAGSPGDRAVLEAQIRREAEDFLARPRLRTWIKVMADYGCWPLWQSHPMRNLDPHALPITERLASELTAWADSYQRTPGRRRLVRSAFDSRARRDRFVADGERLAAALQQQLGPGYYVWFFNPLG